MNFKLVALTVIALPLAACVETTGGTTAIRSGSADAEFACAQAVNRNFGRPVATVTSSEFSEANTVVTLTAGGQNFRCLTSESGEVFEVTATG